MSDSFRGLPFGPANILLPRTGTDLTRWSVVACDQYTSQPEYWAAADRLVGQAPSALRLILPESKLEGEGVAAEIAAVQSTMKRYLTEGIFTEYPDALIYVERRLRSGAVRRGLVGKVDLTAYDYRPGAGSLIRATEGTVLSRIPPRAAVRREAALELPHALLLLDDPEQTVIEPLSAQTGQMRQLYDFDLMADSGHLTGWLLGPEEQAAVAAALKTLADPAAFAEKYSLPAGTPPLLFAVGDGNHSLATAKAIWEESRAPLAQYALVELNNLHDASLVFEPVHRLVFGVEPQALLTALKSAYPGAHDGPGEGHTLRWVTAAGEGSITIPDPKAQLAVGTLQTFLDAWLAQTPQAKIDYIHGDDVTCALARQAEDRVGFLLPAMGKDQLFPTVLFDGVLPRKTFSMGEAHDKRFYLEGRKIR